MTNAASPPSAFASAVSLWLERLRFLLAVGLLWAGLHYAASPLVLRGLDRPLLLCAAPEGGFPPILTALSALLIIWLGTHLVTWIAGGPNGVRTFAALGLALTLWAAEGGTMDDWLLLRNEKPDQAIQSAAPAYWALLGDYALFLLVLLGAVEAVALARFGIPILKAPTAEARRERLQQAFAWAAPLQSWQTGIAALFITSGVAAVILLILAGPRTAHTLRGQTYFAVLLAFALGAVVAHKLTQVRQPLWYWPAPLLVGVIGAVWAALSPVLPGAYAHLNAIPAHGLVRPLPVEMVGVGLVAIGWALHMSAQSAPPSLTAEGT